MKVEYTIFVMVYCAFQKVDWINEYHKRILDTIGEELRVNKPEAYNWLEARTRPITRTVSSSIVTYPSFALLSTIIIPLFVWV